MQQVSSSFPDFNGYKIYSNIKRSCTAQRKDHPLSLACLGRMRIPPYKNPTVSQPHLRPLKRKHEEFRNTPRPMPKHVAGQICLVDGKSGQFDQRHLQAYVQSEHSIRRYLAHQQLSNFRQPVSPNSSFSFTQNAAQKDAVVSNEWRREWDEVYGDLAPSRPLSMLMEPVYINLNTHLRRAKRVFLSHFDINDEPAGRIAQRLRQEEKERKRFQQDLQEASDEKIREIRRVKERFEVRRAARKAEVVDLTDDNQMETEVPWTHKDIVDLENLPPPRSGNYGGCRCSHYFSNELQTQIAPWEPRALNSIANPWASPTNFAESDNYRQQGSVSGVQAPDQLASREIFGHYRCV